MDEKRKFPRFKIGVEVHWKKISDVDGKTAQHISHNRNLSAGGICLVLHPEIKVGDMLQLDIKLPNRNSIHVKGQVRWMDYNVPIPGRKTTACEGGIEFLDIDEAAQKELHNFTSSSSIYLSHK